MAMDDLTTHQTGFMQASAANGFQTTSMADCSGTPFNFQPEFNTAKSGNINSVGRRPGRHQHRVRDRPLGGLHLAQRPDRQPARPERHAARSTTSATARTRTPARPTATRPRSVRRSATWRAPPIRAIDGPGTSTTPRQDDRLPGHDLPERRPRLRRDPVLDGMAHRPHTDIYPSSFLEPFPTSNGRQYPQFFFQTDVALSESTCGGNSLPGGTGTPAGCTVPPPGAGRVLPVLESGPGNGGPARSSSATCPTGPA